MRHVFMGLTLAVACCTALAQGDELLFQYEGDVFPWESGWKGSETSCDGLCVESIENGHFVLRFISGGDIVQYSRIVVLPGVTPPLLVGRVELSVEHSVQR